MYFCLSNTKSTLIKKEKNKIDTRNYRNNTNVLYTGSPRVPARPSTILPSMKNISRDQRDTVF